MPLQYFRSGIWAAGRFAFAYLLGASAASTFAGTFQWPEGKRIAVSLTFDDARESQIDVGVPLLNRHGVKATFYVLPDRIRRRIPDWKAALQAGHEVGNHSVTHPCTANEGFSTTNALEYYTLERMAEELDTANVAIERMLGIQPQSFAYPCGQTFVGIGRGVQSYVPLVASRFRTGRTYRSTASNRPEYCDFAQVSGIDIDGISFEKLKSMLEAAAAQGSWLVLGAHEVGTSGYQVARTDTLVAFCNYVNDPKNGVWAGTVSEIADYISARRVSVLAPPAKGDRAMSLTIQIAAGLISFLLAVALSLKVPPMVSNIAVPAIAAVLLGGAFWMSRYGYMGSNSVSLIIAVAGLSLGTFGAVLWRSMTQKPT